MTGRWGTPDQAVPGRDASAGRAPAASSCRTVHHYLTRRAALDAVTRVETAPVLRTYKAAATLRGRLAARHPRRRHSRRRQGLVRTASCPVARVIAT